MGVGRPRRHSSSMDKVDEDGNVLWHGAKLGEFWKTDMQVAINDSNRREDASFTIRMGKAGTSLPYQQPIPLDFARYHKTLYMESITLEGPTGQTWSTVLRPFQQVVRFGKGWRQFSIENHLQEGYQLLFTLVPRFRFRVQFFDHLGKRCTSYPPLPVAQPGSLPAAETQRQPDLQPGFQQVVDGGQASDRRGSEAPTSAAAASLMGTGPISAVRLNSDQDKIILRQYGPEVPGPEASLPHEQLTVPTFDAGNDSEDMKTEDEKTEALEEDNNYIRLDSDNDDVLIFHPPATKPPLVKPERNMLTLNELFRRQLPKSYSRVNQAHPPQTQYNYSPSSDDELPFQNYPEMQKKVKKPVTSSDDEFPFQSYPEMQKKVKKPVTSSDDELPFQSYPGMQKKVKKPVTRKKVTVKRRPPVAPPVAGSHDVGASSGSSPAMRLLQQQGCMRFSDIISKCERRDVSDQERRVAVKAAKRFASKLGNEKFLVVMRDAQVYQGFHLAIPEKILQATGTERANKVEVCLLDREQALYKAHWTRQNFCDTPLLDQDAWAKFAVDHTLEEGDVCVFQLLLSKFAVSMPAFLFCVHIFRVVETPVGQLDFSDAIDNN